MRSAALTERHSPPKTRLGVYQTWSSRDSSLGSRDVSRPVFTSLGLGLNLGVLVLEPSSLGLDLGLKWHTVTRSKCCIHCLKVFHLPATSATVVCWCGTGKVFWIGTVRYHWPMSAHASQAFSIASCTDSEDLPVAAQLWLVCSCMTRNTWTLTL